MTLPTYAAEPIQVGVFVNDAPATRDEALEAFHVLWWTVEDDTDADQGIWIVRVDPATFDELQGAGGFERHVGSVDINAELP